MNWIFISKVSYGNSLKKPQREGDLRETLVVLYLYLPRWNGAGTEHVEFGA